MSPAFLLRLVLGCLLQPALCALVLLYPPGDLAWGRAWVLVAIFFAASVVSVTVLARTSAALLAERFKSPIQRGQPGADRLVVVALLVAFAGAMRFIPYDVFRFHLLPPPSVPVSAGGLALFLAGWWIVMAAMRANAFAIPAVKHQEERHHHVVDAGPYAVVRHPMYAGAALLQIGMPLWLESSAGALVALVPIAILAVRIGIEEDFLRRELPGYNAYTTRVRARLIPGVW